MKDFLIFVLDDDRQFCRLLEALAEQGFFKDRFPGHNIVVKTHCDTQHIPTAVNWIRENRPDLVLLDYMLGTSSDACLYSLDVLERIILCCHDIIVVSGLYAEDVRMKLAKEGFDKLGIKVLQKPFGIEELIAIITESIEKGKHGRTV